MPATHATPFRRSSRSQRATAPTDRKHQTHTEVKPAAHGVYPGDLAHPSQMVPEAAPVILSARPLLTTCPILVRQFREARCELLLAATWERLVVSCEKTLADVILVDYDAVERAYHAGTGRRRISGHRLISLLARGLATQACERPRALVVVSQMDYAELEDLVHLGIHALERPDQPERLVGRILATYRRVALNHMSRVSRASYARQNTTQAPVQVTDAAWAVIATALAMAGVAARRARVSDRAVFAGLCSLALSGAPWRMYPADCGSVSLARRRLAQWRAAGVFTRLGWAAQSGAHAIQPIMALPWDRLTSPTTPRRKEAVGTPATPQSPQNDWALATPRE